MQTKHANEMTEDKRSRNQLETGDTCKENDSYVFLFGCRSAREKKESRISPEDGEVVEKKEKLRVSVHVNLEFNFELNQELQEVAPLFRQQRGAAAF